MSLNSFYRWINSNFFSFFTGDKPAAMKHSNQSATAESKSSNAHVTKHKLLYSILSILMIGLYSLILES